MKLDWRLRMAAKMMISRLPVGYGTWRRLALFRHGRMEDPAYALGVFRQHYQRYLAAGGRPDGYSLLELGPGDSMSTALIAHVHGAKEVLLVDAVAAARQNTEPYRLLANHLETHDGHRIPPSALESCDALLASCNARYLTDGLVALRNLPSASVDFILSHAVLEHVRREEFEVHLLELHRILRTGGIMSHRIDFKDHLGGALNNLRFSSRWWESPLFVRSGFYTNRLRASELLGMLRDSGFECRIVKQDIWPHPPIRRSQLFEEFARLADDDLRISGLDVVCVRMDTTL